jgi:hypothetical protein
VDDSLTAIMGLCGMHACVCVCAERGASGLHVCTHFHTHVPPSFVPHHPPIHHPLTYPHPHPHTQELSLFVGVDPRSPSARASAVGHVDDKCRSHRMLHALTVCVCVCVCVRRWTMVHGSAQTVCEGLSDRRATDGLCVCVCSRCRLCVCACPCVRQADASDRPLFLSLKSTSLFGGSAVITVTCE